MPLDLLVIDPSQDFTQGLLRLATAVGITMRIAENGDIGYRQAALLRPSMILMEADLPDLSGFVVCRRLKANPATMFIPVLFLSPRNDAEHRLFGYAVGAVDYIGKPCDADDLMLRIRLHLYNREHPADAGTIVRTKVASSREVLVAATKRILEARMNHPPSLTELLALLGTNRRRINRAFQSCCGLSVFAWFRERRLQQAHYWVCATDTPIALIGRQLGFSSPANFAKAFHARFGFSARQMRQAAVSLQTDPTVRRRTPPMSDPFATEDEG